jgi:regulator of sigma E protease
VPKADVWASLLVLIEGTSKTYTVLETTVTYIGRIFMGKDNGGQISGVLGMTKAAGDITKNVASSEGTPAQKTYYVILNLINMIGAISVGVGFINLLPIPPLDGGHLLFYTYQAITGKTVDVGIQNMVFRVAIILVFGLMLFGFWNDFHNTGLASFFKGLFS